MCRSKCAFARSGGASQRGLMLLQMWEWQVSPCICMVPWLLPWNAPQLRSGAETGRLGMEPCCQPVLQQLCMWLRYRVTLNGSAPSLKHISSPNLRRGLCSWQLQVRNASDCRRLWQMVKRISKISKVRLLLGAMTLHSCSSQMPNHWPACIYRPGQRQQEARAASAAPIPSAAHTMILAAHTMILA